MKFYFLAIILFALGCKEQTSKREVANIQSNFSCENLKRAKQHYDRWSVGLESFIA